jgi:hypothetical protein
MSLKFPPAAHIHATAPFRQPITARATSFSEIAQDSLSSLERISRLRPNLQQFSCTFVKPKKAAIDAMGSQSPYKLSEFKPVRQKNRRICTYYFLHAVAYLE